MRSFISQPKPGLISGLLMTTLIVLLVMIPSNPEIEETIVSACLLFTALFWILSCYVVNQYRHQNTKLVQLIFAGEESYVKRCHGFISTKKKAEWTTPEDGRRHPERVPSHVKKFWEEHPEFK